MNSCYFTFAYRGLQSASNCRLAKPNDSSSYSLSVVSEVLILKVVLSDVFIADLKTGFNWSFRGF